MSVQSAARRVRARSMSFGLWASVIAFVVIEGDALLDQSEIGHASILFMFGTACLAAAACIGLFAVISAIGLAVSAAFSDEPLQQQSDAPAVAGAHLEQPLIQLPTSLAPGRPTSRRQPQPLRARALATEARKVPPPAL
jgi:hypothetical protein